MRALATFGIYFVLMAHIDRTPKFWHCVFLTCIAMMFLALMYYPDLEGKK